MRGRLASRARLRSVGISLLTVGVLAAATTVGSAASAAPEPGGVSLSDVQVTATGITAILTARTANGATIDPASVKATLGGVDAAVSVLSLIHISEPTRRTPISYAVF